MQSNLQLNLTAEKVYVWATLLLAFSLPFRHQFSNITLVIWLLCFCVCQFRARYNKVTTILSSKDPLPSVATFGMLALFAVAAGSYLYAADASLVTSRLFGSRLIMLLLPVCCLFGLGKLPFPTILKAYIVGTFFYIPYAYFYGVERAYELAPDMVQTFIRNMDLGFLFPVHRIYSCTNVVIANAALFYLLVKGYLSKGYKLFSIVFVSSSVLYLILSNSRTAIGMALVLCIIYLLCIFVRNVKILLVCALIVTIISSLLIFVPSRFQRTIHTVVVDHEFNDPRSDIWEAAIDVSPNKVFCGLGTNNYVEPMGESLEEVGLDWGRNAHIGAHNMYLEMWIENGWLGVAILLVVLGCIVYSVPTERRLFGYSFVMLMAGIMLIENYLSRQNGAFIFTFFSMFISVKDGNNDLSIHLSTKQKTGLTLFLTIATIISLIAFLCVCWSIAA